MRRSTLKTKTTHKRTRKAIVRELDKVFSEYIRKRDGQCIVCGVRRGLQCGHLFTRAAYSTRWDEWNAWGQCPSCNMRHEYDWMPMQNAVARKGIDVDLLYSKHKKVQKYSDSDLEGLIEFYKEKSATL